MWQNLVFYTFIKSVAKSCLLYSEASISESEASISEASISEASISESEAFNTYVFWSCVDIF